MKISRYIQKEEDVWEKIPKEFYILEEEWQHEIKANDSLMLFSDFENFEPIERYLNTAILLGFGNKELAQVRLVHGRLSIIYDKESLEIVVKLAQIADSLKAYLMVSHFREYPKSKIQAAQKRLLKKNKQSKEVYQKDSFGGSNLWLAIKGDLTQVLEYFQLEGQEKPWAEALLNMHSCEGIFAYSFRGWTFLAGMDVGELLAPYPEGEQAIEQHHLDKLLEWGKEFVDVQMYYYYNRVEYMNAYYRVLNGQVDYGNYYTETYQNTHGKIPSNIKDLPSDDASTIASEWSFDPDYLRYCKELAGATAWVVSRRQ